MKVIFKTNLGSTDAAKFGLDPAKCIEGVPVEVPDAIGEVLYSGGFATVYAEEKPVVKTKTTATTPPPATAFPTVPPVPATPATSTSPATGASNTAPKTGEQKPL